MRKRRGPYGDFTEKYDDSDRSGRLKLVTVGLAIYGNVDDVQQQVG